MIVTERLYVVSYIDKEDGEEYQAVVPEFALPDIDNITDIEVCGRLMEGYAIVADEDPEDPEPEEKPTPIRRISNK